VAVFVRDAPAKHTNDLSSVQIGEVDIFYYYLKDCLCGVVARGPEVPGSALPGFLMVWNRVNSAS
jgi:hypothetical protein